MRHHWCVHTTKSVKHEHSCCFIGSTEGSHKTIRYFASLFHILYFVHRYVYNALSDHKVLRLHVHVFDTRTVLETTKSVKHEYSSFFIGSTEGSQKNIRYCVSLFHMLHFFHRYVYDALSDQKILRLHVHVFDTKAVLATITSRIRLHVHAQTLQQKRPSLKPHPAWDRTVAGHRQLFSST